MPDKDYDSLLLASRRKTLKRLFVFALIFLVLTLDALSQLPPPPQSAPVSRVEQCENGELRSCDALADEYYHGFNRQRDIFKAVEHYRIACDVGNMGSCSQLAMMYSKGEGVRLDKMHAARLFKRACVSNIAGACVYLGQMNESGDGIAVSKETALELFGKACDLRNEYGCKEYARLMRQTR